jgi:pimeloyl-ACP methyl ester carboxylesterase
VTGPLPSAAALADRCAVDGELALAARHWTGGLHLGLGEHRLGLQFVAGRVRAGDPGAPGGDVIGVDGPMSVWELVLAPTPRRFFTELSTAVSLGLVRQGDELSWWQRYPAVSRVVEILRGMVAGASAQGSTAEPGRAPGALDSPVGGYVHVPLDGVDHRIYVEQAGTGVPMLLQHTAGSHGVQWRHLFERPEITDRFRLIAYDLPFHGKSLPPAGVEWWAEPYRLTRDRAMALPVALAGLLGLDRPVFMGCSVGGLLALDLARYHPEVFRAVVALEPSLKVTTDIDSLHGFWHPQVGNEFKARVMRALMSPTAPEAYRRETEFAYASGWPPAFLGDLHYYLVDHDLTVEAANIDTGRVQVHLLTGEYDASATLEHGRAAHAAIRGSTFTEMPGLGHFPMSEDPDRFVAHLLPILDLVLASP